MQTTGNLIFSHIIPEKCEIDRSPRVSNEISHRCKKQTDDAVEYLWKVIFQRIGRKS